MRATQTIGATKHILACRGHTDSDVLFVIWMV